MSAEAVPRRRGIEQGALERDRMERRDSVNDSDYTSETEQERPDRPFHKVRDSLFSSASGFHNYRGLLNDCILLLVLSNTKNVVTNLLKYGLLVNPLRWGENATNCKSYPSYGLMLVCWVFPVFALKCEQAAAKGSLSSRVLLICHLINLGVMLSTPVVVVFTFDMETIGRFIVLICYTILWLKMVSYMQVNWWCRNRMLKAGGSRPNGGGSRSDKKGGELVKYPNNLNFKDLLYFWAAPTFCYELNFPRTQKIRKFFLIRRILEAIFLLNVILAIIQQWLVPTALNSLQPFKEMEYTRIIERVLLLAVPNHLMWLIGFYWVFHSVLNINGELLRFGDRQFYKDWWNAETISRFWSTWNIPVHRWAVRHVYSPLLKIGYNRVVCQLAAFALSAFFHEYIVSISLRMVRSWAFVAMLAQVPLGLLTSLSFTRGQIGNVMVWTSIVLGQPIAILMYLHDYYWINWAPLNVNATITSTWL